MKTSTTRHSLLAVLLLSSAGAAFGQTTTVQLDSGNVARQDVIYSDKAFTLPLTAGTTAAGDGAVLQFGYYQTATTTNLFGNGTFVALSGPGSRDTFTTTSIGDLVQNGAGAGTFALGMNFSTAAGSATGNDLPAAGTLLAIRFYNGTTLANSTAYNAVADSLWTWVAPADTDSQVSLSFNDNDTNTPLTWLGGASTAFYTSQPFSSVPEPSALVGAVGLTLLFISQRLLRRPAR